MARRRSTTPAPRRKPVVTSDTLPFSGPNAVDPAKMTVNQQLREIGAILARAVLRNHRPSSR